MVFLGLKEIFEKKYPKTKAHPKRDAPTIITDLLKFSSVKTHTEASVFPVSLLMPMHIPKQPTC